MVETELLRVILVVIFHTVVYIITDFMDIMAFKRILLNQKKSLFFSFIGAESFSFLLLISLFFLCIFKCELYSCILILNIFYLIISIILIIFLIVYYYFIFKDHVSGKSIEFENLLLLTGSIILHIINNFLFIPDFICVRTLIKKKIEGGDLNSANPSDNNEAESGKEDTKHSNINNDLKEGESNDINVYQKDQTLYIIVEGNIDNKEDNIYKVEGTIDKNGQKTENNIQTLDTIIKKMNDVSDLNSGRKLLKKIKVSNLMKIKSISNFDTVCLDKNNVFPDMTNVRIKKLENKSNKVNKSNKSNKGI